MTEILIIGTNLLVVIASILVAVVTGADVMKDQNKTIREAIAGLIAVNNRSWRRSKDAVPEGQEQLRLVVDDDDKAAN